MATTGWKSPSMVKQDISKQINNNRACYPFLDLADIKKDGYNYAYIGVNGGIDLNHKSPVIYTGGYGFKIPSMAVINKIHVLPIVQQGTNPEKRYNLKKYWNISISKINLLRLKMGTSTTDYGVNPKNISYNIKLPYKTWTNETNALVSGTPEEWGISKLTPSITNNSNFGMVFQAVGTIVNGWVMPKIAKLLMKIDYTVPIQENTNPTLEGTFDISVTLEKNVKLDINDKNSVAKLKIKYSHKGNGGQSPQLTSTSSDLKIGPSKLRTYNIPTINVSTNNSNTAKEYTQIISVYPGTISGIHTVQIKQGTKVVSTIYIEVVGTGTAISDEDKNKFLDSERRCVINNSIFNKNKAEATGGAIYVLSGRLYRTGNTFGTGSNQNTAKTCPNIKLNKDCIEK